MDEHQGVTQRLVIDFETAGNGLVRYDARDDWEF